MDLPQPARRLRHRYQRVLDESRGARRRTAPPLPAGATGGPPDFVGLGAQKAGTTWWFRLIIEHPRAAPCSQGVKELDFFAPYWDREFTTIDRDQYHRHFPRQPGVLRGEWTPEYLLDAWAPACLHDAAPAARLLVLLRDPVERFRSSITHVTAGIRRPTMADVRIAYQRGCYLSALRGVLAHFPRESLLVLQYERCRMEPHVQLRRTYTHLGLDDRAVPASHFSRPVNVTEVPKVSIGPAALERLRSAYRTDVDSLATDFPEIDLELWPNFKK